MTSNHKKTKIIALLLLVAAIVCICLAEVHISSVQTDEYAVLCPQRDNDGSLIKAADQFLGVIKSAQRQMPDASITGYVYKQHIHAEQKPYHESDTSLTAIASGYFDVYFTQLVSGRSFSTDEMESGAAVALINETLAKKIYGDESPLGLNLTVMGTNFTVVGVVRHESGLQNEKMYVPLRSLPQTAYLGDTMTFGALDNGNYSHQMFLSIAQKEYPSGTEHRSCREKMLAMLPFRFLSVAMLCYILFSLLPVFKRTLKSSIRTWQEKKEQEYANRMILPTIWLFIKCILMCSTLVFAVYVILKIFIAPAFVFPELVPANLSRLRDYRTVFNTLQENSKQLVTIATEHSLRIKTGGTIGNIGCALALLSCALFLHIRHKEGK